VVSRNTLGTVEAANACMLPHKTMHNSHTVDRDATVLILKVAVSHAKLHKHWPCSKLASCQQVAYVAVQSLTRSW
jgi:hypothetical protein